jgi:hypothetical protein
MAEKQSGDDAQHQAADDSEGQAGLSQVLANAHHLFSIL